MTALQLTLIAAVVLPALAIVLWPLLGRRAGTAASPVGRASDDRRLELEEEKAALYRALRELDFDHEAGHLSDPDYQGLRERYESRAGALITELDALGSVVREGPDMAPALPRPRATQEARASWTRHPATFAAGAVALLVFGVIIGVNAGRFTERDESFTPPGARLPVPGPPPAPVVPPNVRLEPGQPIPPEMLAGMLQAARQSLFEGRYSEAIAAYQAVLKRDERNVDAMTHLGLIVAVGGHADSALETFDRALEIDPQYAPAYLYRGQVLYEQKQDYPGAVAAWERFMALVPKGEDRDRVAELVKRARSQPPPR
ncbi:MAG TPA: tetratricopeptide repeat protein [Candidatus Limnocylindria bacterium]|nr:tetratricopeptide repeat protein [Candidatus Limnocylindria bacterium]